MNLIVNGQSQVPPGFRFHPTEEELLHYYLRKKVAEEKIDLDVIPCVDLNKLEPWDIQEKCKIGSAPQNEWYFFSHNDKKYPTGTRTNRATVAGFWKATGRDKVVYNNVGRIGLRKTLVFYTGRAPCGQKSDWIMHEYRLDGNAFHVNVCNIGEAKAEDGWVVCRLLRKRNHCKDQEKPQMSSSSIYTDLWTQIHNSSNDGDLDQIIRSMAKPCKQEKETTTSSIILDINNNSSSSDDRGPPEEYDQMPLQGFKPCSATVDYNRRDELDWVEIDLEKLVAPNKLSRQVLEIEETSKQMMSCFYGEPSWLDLYFLVEHHLQVPGSDMDAWTFT